MTPSTSKIISPEEYLSIFKRSKLLKDSIEMDLSFDVIMEKSMRILDSRTSNGLSIEDSAFLLNYGNKYPEIYCKIKEYSAALRFKLFSSSVSVMAPLEYGSSCMSNCTFCGWRSTNYEMPRLKLSEEGIMLEAEHLARLGFSHIELSGGDNLSFLKNSLHKYLRILKDSASKILPELRSSICLTPLHFQHYQSLRNESGLDVVLTWQETYEKETFEHYVVGGPKRFGIDEQFNLLKSGNGFLSRLQSQELAIRAGLQVGIGTMIGLNKSPEADLLACLAHGRKLVEHFNGQLSPLIFGLPIWRPITTPKTDMQEERVKLLNIDDLFILTSAIYLLGMPDYYAWVFANCRVPVNVQIEAIRVAGTFSSTEVSVAPGGYRAKGTNNHKEYLSVATKAKLNCNDLIKKGEQFSHFFASHEKYLNRFKEEKFNVVSDYYLLNLGGQNVARVP